MGRRCIALFLILLLSINSFTVFASEADTDTVPIEGTEVSEVTVQTDEAEFSESTEEVTEVEPVIEQETPQEETPVLEEEEVPEEILAPEETAGTLDVVPETDQSSNEETVDGPDSVPDMSAVVAEEDTVNSETETLQSVSIKDSTVNSKQQFSVQRASNPVNPGRTCEVQIKCSIVGATNKPTLGYWSVYLKESEVGEYPTVNTVLYFRGSNAEGWTAYVDWSCNGKSGTVGSYGKITNRDMSGVTETKSKMITFNAKSDTIWHSTIYASSAGNPIKYKVTYDANGGKFDNGDAEREYEVEKGKATPKSEDPKREGYEFKGWSPTVAATVTKDVTYKAQWEKLPDQPVDNGEGITITKTRKTINGDSSKTSAEPGDTIVWNIVVKNLSNVEKKVTLTEKLEGATLSEDSFTLAAGGTKTVTATYVVKEEDAGSMLYNTVNAATGGTGDKENPTGTDAGTDVGITVTWINGINNSLIKQITIKKDADYKSEYPNPDPEMEGYTFTEWSEPVADDKGNITIRANFDQNATSTTLTVIKTADKSEVKAGDTVEYTIIVTNTGETDAKNVKVTDILPEGLELVSASIEPDGNVYAIGDIPAGEERTLTITAKVSENVAAGTELINTAVADYTNKPEDDPDPSGEAKVTVVEEEKPANEKVTVTLKYVYVDEDGNETELKENVEILVTKGEDYDVNDQVPETIAKEDQSYKKDSVEGDLKGTADEDLTIVVKYVPEESEEPDPKPEDPKPVDPTPEDPKPVDPTPEDPTPEDPTPEDPTPEDPAPEDPTPEDPTPEDPTPEDPTPEDPTPGNPTPGTPTPGNPTPGNPTPGTPTPTDPAVTPTTPIITPITPVTPTTPVITPIAPATPNVTPAAPITPVITLAAPTPTPITPTVTPAAQAALTPVSMPEAEEAEQEEQPEARTLPDEETPLANADLEDEEVPLANNDGRWALINFALMNLSIFESLMLLIGYFVQTKKSSEEEEDEKERKLKKKGIVRIISLPVAIISMIAFFLTENIWLPTQLVDQYTLMMAVIAVIQTIVVVLSRKEEDVEEEEPEAEMA